MNDAELIQKYSLQALDDIITYLNYAISLAKDKAPLECIGRMYVLSAVLDGIKGTRELLEVQVDEQD